MQELAETLGRQTDFNLQMVVKARLWVPFGEPAGMRLVMVRCFAPGRTMQAKVILKLIRSGSECFAAAQMGLVIPANCHCRPRPTRRQGRMEEALVARKRTYFVTNSRRLSSSWAKDEAAEDIATSRMSRTTTARVRQSS